MRKIVLKSLVVSLALVILSFVSIIQDYCGKSWAKTGNKTVMTKFKNIYEASGVQQIADGRVVIIEDEKTRAIRNMLTFVSENTVQEDPLRFSHQSKRIKTKLNDLEGIAVDGDDNVFAITSHSRSVKGKLKHSRGRLVRFKIKGNLITNFEGVETLGTCIRNKIGINEINIEAISFDADRKKLLIGLREPLIEGKSLIVVLENPNAIFDHHEEPKISDHMFRLDLNGGGIRAMDFDQKLGGYLLVNEIKNTERKIRSKFWFWTGTGTDKPRKVTILEMENVKNIEGISSVRINGEPRILVVSDDGKMYKQKCAHYKVIHYDQLLISPIPVPKR